MNIVFGLIGAKGAGKTTAFNYIASKYPNVVELTLADKLKTACSQVFDIPRNYFDSHSYKEKDLEEPIYLNSANIRQIWEFFDIIPNFDDDIRFHMGKILFTPRQIAQYVGTEVLRAKDPDIHCKSCVNAAQSGDIGVLTDIRFPNELRFFKEKFTNFVPIYIKNTKAEQLASEDAHVSESFLHKLAAECFYKTQDGSIEQLQSDIQKILDDTMINNKRLPNIFGG